MKYNLFVKYVVNLVLNVDVIKRKCVMLIELHIDGSVLYYFMLGKRGRGMSGNSSITLHIYLLLGSNVLGWPFVGAFNLTAKP